MTIIKCDICHKTIKDKSSMIGAGFGYFYSRFSFCAKCGKPIQDFLKKHGLVEEESKTKTNPK